LAACPPRSVLVVPGRYIHGFFSAATCRIKTRSVPPSRRDACGQQTGESIMVEPLFTVFLVIGVAFGVLALAFARWSGTGDSHRASVADVALVEAARDDLDDRTL
jgi:hypothetical protein